MKNKIKFDIGYERYNEFNLVIIMLATMVIFLPIIAYLIRLIIPNMIRCFYYEFTSNPCPFCGVTSDIRNIIKGNIFAPKYNMISMPVLICSVLEIIGRVSLICNKSKLKYIDLRVNVFKVDFIYHGIIFMLILIYILAFFMFHLRRF